MNRSFSIVLIGAVIAGISLLGFVVPGSSSVPNLRYGFVGFFLVANAALFLAAARAVTLPVLMGIGVLIALFAVGAEQTLGFCFFHGLVKDLSFFSAEHLRNVGGLLGMAVVCYSLIALLAHLIAKRLGI